jgi:hypothetical protein
MGIRVSEEARSKVSTWPSSGMEAYPDFTKG